jgi:hypothetical protein
MAPSVRPIDTYGIELDLLTALGGRVFGISGPAPGSPALVVRIDADGTITRRTLSDPVAPYYSQLVVAGSSLYVGTSVIRRFTSAADEVLRIDPSTLTVTARSELPENVIGLVADGHSLWAALPDRVVRLDADSLAVRASHVLVGADVPPAGSTSVGSLSLGPGGLWATSGDAAAATLYRLDPASLAILGRTSLPDPGQVGGVIAGPESIWLTGTDWVRRVDPTGQLADPLSTPGLQAASARGQGLEELVYVGPAAEALVQIDTKGNVVGSSDVGDAGARLAIDGTDAWLPQGLSLEHWKLLIPPP